MMDGFIESALVLELKSPVLVYLLFSLGLWFFTVIVSGNLLFEPVSHTDEYGSNEGCSYQTSIHLDKLCCESPMKLDELRLSS